MFYFDRLNGDRWLSCFMKSMCIEKLQEHVVFCFDRSFPWCGRRLFSAEAAGEVGPVSGLDGLPSEGSWRAESWSGHSLCRVKEGKIRTKRTLLYVVFSFCWVMNEKCFYLKRETDFMHYDRQSTWNFSIYCFQFIIWTTLLPMHIVSVSDDAVQEHGGGRAGGWRLKLDWRAGCWVTSCLALVLKCQPTPAGPEAGCVCLAVGVGSEQWAAQFVLRL